MTPKWTCVLFDLDGTILDSAPGITASLAYMFEKLGRPIPTPGELLQYVGPPILDSFRGLAGMDSEQAVEALKIYRSHYGSVGALDSSVYPGIPALLQDIRDSPIPLSLATSKPESLATLMLGHFGLVGCFDVITGASEDERRSRKADVVALALERLERIGADISMPVMVGDRRHDVDGAAEHGVPTIFVSWGYGSPAEAAGAVGAATTAAELHKLLLGQRVTSASGLIT